MNTKTFLLTMLAGVLSLYSCKKENDAPSTPTPLSFDSLVSQDLEISFTFNPSTKITAYAKGDGLTYRWSATAGDILGSGKQVTYTANANCCGGYQRITCNVKDKYGKWMVKQVNIYVHY